MKRLVERLEALGPWPVALILGLVAGLLFGWRLGDPAQLMFDEVYYVPAGRDTFGLVGPSNEEHPLLAKWLIGLSIALFGDTPAGWRALAVLAGSGTVLALFAIVYRLLRDTRAAATAALLATLNQMLFVQARIAMLEVFAGFFLFASMALLLWGQGRPGRRWLVAAGASFGLAVGAKWSVLPLLPLPGLIALLGWRARWLEAGLSFGSAAALAYLATFLPALLYTTDALKLDTVLGWQAHMFELQTRPLARHTYQSTPWQWPLMTRPIWYLYEPVRGVQRGVFLVGNPAVMWGGLVAVLACLWSGLRERKPVLVGVAAAWAYAFGIWLVIPKKIGFFYYYYIPGLILPLALAVAFHHGYRSKDRWLPAAFLGLSFALFAWFYPILSALPLPNDRAFERWMWLSTWP